MLTPDLLRGINSLPTLPGVLGQILHTLEDTWASAKDLETIVANDQALSSKMLAAANSAYYGFPQQVTTVHRAALVLGFDEVRKICLGASLIGFMQKANPQALDLSQRLWRHSLWVAEAARILTQLRDAPTGLDPEGAFTAGLLHDVGKVVLVAFFPEAAQALLDMMARQRCSWRQAEVELELDHQDIGLYLAEHWNLPPLLAEVMGRHHEPDPGLAYLPTVLVVHLADWLVYDLEASQQAEPEQAFRPLLVPEALPGLGLGAEHLARARQVLASRADSLDQLWQSFQAA